MATKRKATKTNATKTNATKTPQTVFGEIAWTCPVPCQPACNWPFAGVAIASFTQPSTMTPSAVRDLQAYLHAGMDGDLHAFDDPSITECVFELYQARNFKPAAKAAIEIIRSCLFHTRIPATREGVAVLTYAGFLLPEGMHITRLLKATRRGDWFHITTSK